MSEVVEIARFRVAEAAEDGLVAAWPVMADAMRRAHPDLRSIELVRYDDGTWADIAVWADRSSADAACATGPELPEVKAFFAHIAEDVSMDVAAVVRRADPR